MPNSQDVQKDVHVSESRKSDDRENEVHQHRETCGSDHCVDFRIPGIPHSAVKNPRICLLKWAITKSSSSTRLLRRDNVQIAPYIGKLVSKTAHAENACSLRKKSRQVTYIDRFDILSIPGHLIKKNQSLRPRHGRSMRQIMYHKGRGLLSQSQTSKDWIVRNNSGKMVHRVQPMNSRCLMKDGLKKKSDNTTHLPGKTIPMKLHLKKASSEPTPEEPLRWGGAQGGSGQTLPTGSPKVVCDLYSAVLVNLLHPSRDDTYDSCAVSVPCPTCSDEGAAMSGPPRRGEHSPAELVVSLKTTNGSPCTIAAGRDCGDG